MEQKNYGLIYVLSNKYMPNIVKIGKTTKKNVEERMNSLYFGASGVPINFHCEHAYRVPLDKLDILEKKIHAFFAEKRINPDREFFEVTPEEVDKLFFVHNELLENATDEVQTEIDKATKADVLKHRRPTMDFSRMGLQIGQVLHYTKDLNITCSVASNRKVLYNGHESSLSSLTQQLLGYAAQPSPYWQTEEGVSLVKLYINSVQEEAADVAALQKSVDNKRNPLL